MTTEFLKEKNNLFLFILVVLMTFFFWLSTINIPYWWDSAGFIMQAAKYYIDNNFSSFILPSDSGFSAMAHPPFFPFILALIWKIFGESIFISHLFYLLFILLVIIFTYLLGRELSRDTTEGCFIGFFSSALLLFTPLFFAQIGIIYLEIPFTAFALITVYSFLKKKVKYYLLFASLMFLMRVFSIVIILAILATIFIKFFVKYFKKEQINFKKFIKELFIYSLPISVILLWFLLHKAVNGWMFAVPYYQNAFHKEIFDFGEKFIYQFNNIFRFLFLDQWRFLITFSVSFLFFILPFKKLKKILFHENIILLLLIIFLVPLFFAKLEFLPRYVLFALPFFYLLFFYVLASAFAEEPLKQRAAILGWAALFLSVFFYLSWDNHRRINNFYFAPLEDNLEYLNIIEMGKKTTGFIEKNYPDAFVYTSFPVNYMLSEPFQGYVSKPVKTYECNKYKEGDKVDLIVLHLFSPGEIACKRLGEKLGLSSLVIFEKNGKWMQVLFK